MKTVVLSRFTWCNCFACSCLRHLTLVFNFLLAELFCAGRSCLGSLCYTVGIVSSCIVGCYLLGSAKPLQRGVRVAATGPGPAVLTPSLLMRNLLLVQLSSFATNKSLCLRGLGDILFDGLQVLCKSSWNISVLSLGTGGCLSRFVSFFSLGALTYSEHCFFPYTGKWISREFLLDLFCSEILLFWLFFQLCFGKD